MAARMYLIMAALREERLERRRNRLRRRNQLNLRLIPDLEFIHTYRLSRQLFDELCQEIVPLLPQAKSITAIEPTTRILTALNLYARGCYQVSVGENTDLPMSQQSVSRSLREVTAALNAPHILRKYIKFPQNRNERNIIMQRFHDKYGLSGVIGCIDCTHIAIVKPKQQDEQYLNLKQYYSINTQIICDSDCCITNVDAYCGSMDDASIWKDSDIRIHMESLSHENETVYLLGDSAYALREHMMTPIDNADKDSPEEIYNFVQNRAHSAIERTFAILKGRWRCLLANREMHYDSETAGQIMIACCVLHNLCVRAGIGVPELTKNELEAEKIRQVTTLSASP